MNLDEGLTTKLWLEKQKTSTEEAPSKSIAYHKKNYRLNKKYQHVIARFCQEEPLRWEIIVQATFALLLHRLSTADVLLYGTSALTRDQPTAVHIQEPIHLIKSVIYDTLSVKTFLATLKRQFTKKAVSPKHTPEELRYLLVFKKKKNQKTAMIHAQQFPLVFAVGQQSSSAISIFYHPVLFSKQAIDSLFDHWAVIFQELLQNKHKKIIHLNVLTEKEKRQLLTQWNHSGDSLNIPILTTVVHELFAQHAKRFPHHLALSYQNISITYQALDDASTALAHELLKRNIQCGDHIAVLMERTPTLLMVMLAVLKVGAIYIPINPKYPDERIDYVLNDSKARLIFVNDPKRLSKDYASKIIHMDEAWDKLSLNLEKNGRVLPTIDPEQIAYMIYTSGTTGQPKGVMIRHNSLSNLVAWYQGYFHVTAKDRASQFASQGFDTFLCETIPFLASGASVHIIDETTKLTPALLLNWLQKQKITICDLPTAYSQILLSLPWPKTSLKTVKIGGESMLRYPTQRFSFDILNGYGPTEATIESTFAKIYVANTLPKLNHLSPPPIGKPIAHVTAYVVDAHLQPVPIYVAGELLIGGLGVSVGYWGRDDVTREKFIPSPFDNNGNDRLYRTGDLVRWLPDGNLEFIGRVDHQVKIRGYRIELGDIENAISQHSDVGEVVVIAKENLNGEKSLIAYVVPNLNKQRYLYQERCLLSMDNHQFIEAVTDDISKQGLALSGITESLPIKSKVYIHLKLPGLAEETLLSGEVRWQRDQRCGMTFILNEKEKKILEKSIDYYLSTHNVMDLVLSTAAKRSLRKALRKKLPEYMMPSVFVTLLQFPLTFSGKIDVKALPPPQDFEQKLQKIHIAPKTDIEKKLAIIWSDLLHRKEISITDNFFDLGGSSLTAAELSLKILNDFNISIPTKILFDLPYLPILAEYIETKGEHYAKQSAVQEEIERDAKLHENILPVQKRHDHLNQPQHILLTGAGGFLGIYLLRELLTHSQAKIYCLIRRGEFESAAKRLLSTIQKFQLANDIQLANRRIVAIPGDISLDHFGLPLEQYNHLSENIDLIYHCGAQVNIMAAYNKLRSSNVQGTIEVIKFATTRIDKPIHYISTLSSACRKNSSGALVEEFPDENYDELFGGYAISKWISERLLTEVKNRGLPTIIYRSGYIFGQSDTGMTNLNDALLMLIKGCIQLGFAPEMEEKMTLLPVDFVSKAITKISLAHPENAAIYHIDHPKGILWTDLIAWLNHYGYQITTIPLKKWQHKLVKIPHDNALFPFLPYYLAMKEKDHSPDVDMTQASALLKELQLPYPAIDDKLLSTYMAYLTKINFLPPPRVKVKEMQGS